MSSQGVGAESIARIVWNRITDLLDALKHAFTARIAGTIILPYFLLVCVLAVATATVASNLVTGSLEDRFRDELATGGRSANEAMVMLEDRNNTVLRQMIFTEGVEAALETRNQTALQSLLGPVASNAGINVDVFSPDGARLIAFRPGLADGSAPQVDPAAHDWEPVQRARQGVTDDIGDKHAGFVKAPWSWLFVSAAPVWSDGEVAGVIALSVPIDDVIKRLSQEAGSKGITLYSFDGLPIASTLRVSSMDTLDAALTLPIGTREEAVGSTHLVYRRSTVGDIPYAEALGVLAVRRQPALILGTGNLISVIQDQGDLTRRIMIALACAFLLISFGIGLTIARRLVNGVSPLVDATYRVRRNELNFEVPVKREDELGILATSFNEMRGGLQERERARSAIERYMSPKIYRLIQSGDLKMGGVKREITVFKTDIRGFTSMAERMAPEALVDFLNRYFEVIVAPIAKYDGEVDKYMGDAVLAKFGATEWYPDHARSAVLAMIEMIEACDRLNLSLRQQGRTPIRMGIGCNTGDAVVGNIGAPERMEYTIISDAVNTAQRIEELCKEVDWDLLISDRTYQGARDAIEVGQPWTVRLRGQVRETLVYPVLGRVGAVTLERRAVYERFAASITSRHTTSIVS